MADLIASLKHTKQELMVTINQILQLQKQYTDEIAEKEIVKQNQLIPMMDLQ